MSSIERPPPPPSKHQGSFGLSSAGAFPIVAVALLALLVGVDLVRKPVQVPAYGEAGDLVVARPESDEEYVLVRVEPQLIEGELTTPTWENLFKAYNLRDADMERALADYNRGIHEGETVALKTSRIRPGTELRLPVR